VSSEMRWIPVRSAARLLGVSPQRVYVLIDRGQVVGRKMASTWLVSWQSVRDRCMLMEERRHAGKEVR